jgi:hypothetical protein
VEDGDGKKQREDGLAWLAGASNHIVCKLQTFQGNVLSCLGIISVFFFYLSRTSTVLFLTKIVIILFLSNLLVKNSNLRWIYRRIEVRIQCPSQLD